MKDNYNIISPWLDDLSFNWDAVIEHGKTKKINTFEYLFHDEEYSDKVYIVKYGRVRLFHVTYEGKEKTFSIIGKNGLLGEEILFSNEYNTNAMAVTASEIIEIEKELFESLIFKSAQLSKQLSQMLSLKLELLTHFSLLLTFENPLVRIINSLIYLAIIYGKEEENGYIRILISFTHQELADLIGSSRVTVTNSFATLVNKNLIYKKNNFYYLYSIEALTRLIEN